jgi:hypothetical protein
MKKRKQLLYDEKAESERLFSNGFTDGYDRREASLIAKYMRHVLGYGDIRVKKGIISFCSRYPDEFNHVTESQYIKEFVRNSKYPFIVRERVIITDSEINKVRLIKNFKAQKVYLSMLAIGKKNKTNFVGIRDWTTLKRVSGLRLTNYELGEIFHVLYNNNMLYPVLKNDGGGHKLLYVDWGGKPKIEIRNDKDFYNLGATYENICGGHLSYCVICEKEFVRATGNQKLCPEHSALKEKTRKR